MTSTRKFGRLNVRVGAKGRRLVGGVRDPVSKTLDGCDTFDKVLKAATKVGIAATEVKQRIRVAPNFGQFRMVIGNRMRGIARRGRGR